MPINKKTLLLVALTLGAVSETLANGLDIHRSTIESMQEWPDHQKRTQAHANALFSNRGSVGLARVRPESKMLRSGGTAGLRSVNIAACPWLEGYPDCRPNVGGS
jgi:hypothetical protein